VRAQDEGREVCRVRVAGRGGVCAERAARCAEHREAGRQACKRGRSVVRGAGRGLRHPHVFSHNMKIIMLIIGAAVSCLCVLALLDAMFYSLARIHTLARG
jgi:hypothetical protein